MAKRQVNVEEYFNSLPPEVQEEWRAKRAFHERKASIGAPLAHAENLGVGFGRGLVNATVGLLETPEAISNAAFGTEFDTRPVYGPGSARGMDRHDVGGAAALGGLGGFIGSFALPGGVAARGGKLLGGLGRLATADMAASRAGARGINALATAAGRTKPLIPVVAPTGATRAAVSAADEAVAGANILQRGAAQALEFGALSFARTPGDLESRVAAGLHGLPTGFVLGAAGRGIGIVVNETGKLLTGRAATNFLAKHGGTRVALGGANPVARMESLPRFTATQMGRMGGAGLLLPGFSPVEMTGNARIDSAIFNSLFGLAHGARARVPLIPGREKAQLNALRDNAPGAGGRYQPPPGFLENLRAAKKAPDGPWTEYQFEHRANRIARIEADAATRRGEAGVEGQMPLFPEEPRPPQQGQLDFRAPEPPPSRRVEDNIEPPPGDGPQRSPFTGRFAKGQGELLPMDQIVGENVGRRQEPDIRNEDVAPRRNPADDPMQRPGLYEDSPFGPSIAYPIGTRVQQLRSETRGEVQGFMRDDTGLDRFTVKHDDGSVAHYALNELQYERPGREVAIERERLATATEAEMLARGRYADLPTDANREALMAAEATREAAQGGLRSRERFLNDDNQPFVTKVGNVGVVNYGELMHSARERRDAARDAGNHLEADRWAEVLNRFDGQRPDPKTLLHSRNIFGPVGEYASAKTDRINEQIAAVTDPVTGEMRTDVLDRPESRRALINVLHKSAPTQLAPDVFYEAQQTNAGWRRWDEAPSASMIAEHAFATDYQGRGPENRGNQWDYNREDPSGLQAREVLERTVRKDLGHMDRSLFEPGRDFNIQLVRTSGNIHFAAMDRATNTLYVDPNYYALPGFARRQLLIEELVHGRQSFTRFGIPATANGAHPTVRALQTLYENAGFTSRSRSNELQDRLIETEQKREAVLFDNNVSSVIDLPTRELQMEWHRLQQEVNELILRGAQNDFVFFELVQDAMDAHLTGAPRTGSGSVGPMNQVFNPLRVDAILREKGLVQPEQLSLFEGDSPPPAGKFTQHFNTGSSRSAGNTYPSETSGVWLQDHNDAHIPLDKAKPKLNLIRQVMGDVDPVSQDRSYIAAFDYPDGRRAAFYYNISRHGSIPGTVSGPDISPAWSLSRLHPKDITEVMSVLDGSMRPAIHVGERKTAEVTARIALDYQGIQRAKFSRITTGPNTTPEQLQRRRNNRKGMVKVREKRLRKPELLTLSEVYPDGGVGLDFQRTPGGGHELVYDPLGRSLRGEVRTSFGRGTSRQSIDLPGVQSPADQLGVDNLKTWRERVEAEGGELLIGTYLDAEGTYQHIPIAINHGTRAGARDQHIPDTYFVSPYWEWMEGNADKLTTKPINGSYYAWKNHLEYVGNLAAHRATHGPESLKRTHPGANELLNVLMSNADASVQGQRVLAHQLEVAKAEAEGTPRQGTLFAEQGFNGPPGAVYMTNGKLPEGEPSLLGSRNRNYDRVQHTTERTPQERFLMDDSVKVKIGSGERVKTYEAPPFLLEDAPRQRWAFDILSKPAIFKGEAVQGAGKRLTWLKHDEPTLARVDEIFDSTMERFKDRDLTGYSDVEVNREFIRLMREEGHRMLPERGTQDINLVDWDGSTLTVEPAVALGSSLGGERVAGLRDAATRTSQGQQGKGRIRKSDRQLIFQHSQIAQNALTTKLAVVFNDGATSLERGVRDRTMREIIRLKFGSALGETGEYLYTENGQPLSREGALTNADIATRVKVSTETVGDHIQRFIWDTSVEGARDRTFLNGHPPVRSLPFTKRGTIRAGNKPIDKPDIVDEVNVKTPFRPRGVKEITQQPGQPPVLNVNQKKRQRNPIEVATRVNGNPAIVQHYRQMAKLDGGEPGVDKRVIPGDTVYLDPTTGEILTRQSSMFEGKRVIENRNKAEQDRGVEPASEQRVDPPPPDPVEVHAAEVIETLKPIPGTTPPVDPAVGEALRDQRRPLEPPPPGTQGTLLDAGELDAPAQGRLTGAGFGQSRKPTDTRWKGNKGTEKLATLLASARSKIGLPKMTEAEFTSLTTHDRVEHVLRRLSLAKNPNHYTNILKRYGGFLGAREYPTFAALAPKDKATRWSDVTEAANALHVDLRVQPDGSIRVTERDSGRVVTTRDTGTVALLMDLRRTRLKDAPHLGPAEFEHIKMDFGEGESGPRAPRGEDPAWDGEAGPPPPVPPEGGGPRWPSKERGPGTELFRNRFVAMRKVRAMTDYFATVGKKIGDWDIWRAADGLIKAGNEADRKSQNSLKRMEDLARKHRIGGLSDGLGPRVRARAKDPLGTKRTETMERIGRAAADLDEIAMDQLGVSKDMRHTARFVESIEDSVYNSHGLAANEVAFLKDARKEWNRAWVQFGLEPAGYVPGYFTRFRPRDASKNTSSVLRAAGMPRPMVDFFAMNERMGEFQGRSTHYMNVWAAYTRSGWRYKLLNEKPGAAQPSILEFGRAVIDKYTDKAGSRELIPEWLEPLTLLMDRAKGIPDPGMVAARTAARGRLQQRQEAVKAGLEWIDRNNAPVGGFVKSLMQREHARLGVKISDVNMATWADMVTGLNRGRTFGLHAMRAIRHVTQSWFFTLPRVGPKYFGRALNEMLSKDTFETALTKAQAAGVIKPAFWHDYINSRSKLLSTVDTLSFIYRYGDMWERTLSFRAQEMRSHDAMQGFKQRERSMAFETNFDMYSKESGLNLLHPAFRINVKDQLKRPTPNYAGAVREHARRLSDHTVFDYSRMNQPQWSGTTWGRVFGQYGRWPLGAVETMHAMTRYGTPRQKMEIAATYAAVSAGVYGMGQAFGVETAEWIPYVHSLNYNGGPGLTWVEDIREIMSGDPLSTDTFLANAKHDLHAQLFSAPFRMFIPAADVSEALGAELNFSRRQRRILGLPGPAWDRHQFATRLLGFRPTSDPVVTKSLTKRVLTAPFKPFGKAVREAVGEKFAGAEPPSRH